MKRLLSGWVGALLILGAVACDGSGPLKPGDPGYSVWQAEVTGTLEAAYEGTGLFRIAPASWPIRLTLWSTGTGESDGQGFLLHLASDPAVGTYELDDTPVPGGTGAVATYVIRDEHGERRFTGFSGSVTLDQVESRRIEGHFHFEARLSSICQSVGIGKVCEFPGPDTDEVIVAQGEFSAIRW